MNKKALSERDICTKFITPNIVAAGWDVDTQIREEVGFTDGRIYVRGKIHARGARKRADYILYYKPNIPIAVLEAKDNNHTVGAGIQQALGYAKPLDVPFVFSSNGDGFLFHDNTVKSGDIEKEIPLDAFPSPKDLWQKYKAYKGISDELDSIVTQDYFSDGSTRSPRYYQQVAINRTVEAIARHEGNNRHLLVMATGTGKTYTAFQIIYRLWKNGLKKRILFLADRTSLIDQTVRGDFPEPEKPDVTIDGDPTPPERRRKVTVNGVEVTVIKERVQYMGDDGKIITESLRDYTRKNVRTAYTSLDAFLRSWKQADKKRAIIEELEQHGVIFAALNEEIGSTFDPFDLICHVAFDQKPLTRKERAEQVKKRDYFTKYGDLARKVVSALLDKYSDDGLLDLENPEIIRLDPLSKLGSPVEIIRAFGGKPAYDAAIHALTDELYKVA
jgi:type I site-specific restriction endonuclease